MNLKEQLKECLRKYRLALLLTRVWGTQRGNTFSDAEEVQTIDEDVVWVVGAARSGTTFLAEVAKTSLELDVYSEPRFSQNRKLGITLIDRHVAGFSSLEQKCHEICQTRLPHIKKSKGIYLEKRPEAVYLIPALLKVFPNIRFIHMLRDGRDVAASSVKRFGGNWMPKLDPLVHILQNQRHLDHLRPMEQAALRWDCQVREGFENLQKVAQNRVITICYEELINDLPTQAKRLFKFLKVSYCESELPTVMNEKRKPTDFCDWPQQNKDDFNRFAGDLLVELGYAEDLNW